MKKYFFCLILFVFIFIPSIKADENVEVPKYDYVVDSYHIDMVVNENNSFKITEKIDVYYNVERHGIIRNIPLKNNVFTLDGKSMVLRAKVKDISVNNKFEDYVENDNKIIKIGDEGTYLTGKYSYTIDYLYDLDNDISKEYDEVYFNLIGNEWDTSISNITFNIRMPKDFDKSKLYFTSGSYGSNDDSMITYTVDGNVITGKYNGSLKPSEGLTVRIILPDGYFVDKLDIFDFLLILTFVLSILFSFVGYKMWLKYGKDAPVIETVEFYPPEGLNSLDVGFLYRGEAEKQDVVSLLIYLANKGYIKISEGKRDILNFGRRRFEITKIKNYDGNDPNEKIFLENLFTNGRVLASEDTGEAVYKVDSSELNNSFYVTIDIILSNVNGPENKIKIFDTFYSGKKVYLIFMILIIFSLITIPPFIKFNSKFSFIFAFLLPFLGFVFGFSFIFGDPKTIYVNGVAKRGTFITKVLGVLIILLMVGIPFHLFMLPVLLIKPVYLVAYIFGLACIIVLTICNEHFSKRTVYGTEILGKLKGFKTFLETTEKEKLESLVNENPHYFYDILPYTYVLGVSNKWIKKFEQIAVEEPDWYECSSFNVTNFGKSLNSTFSIASKSMTSTPDTSSGSDSGSFGSGGSSFRGFSGGGSGGGGGRSW